MPVHFQEDENKSKQAALDTEKKSTLGWKKNAYALGFIILYLTEKQRIRTEMGRLRNIFSCIRDLITEFLSYLSTYLCLL